jgi:hypothetical protein
MRRRHPTVPTVDSRRATARRLDRRVLGLTDVLNAMRHGEALHLHHDRRRGPIWWLSGSGREVDAEIARVAIANPDVVAVGDALFASIPSQTYRYVEEDQNNDHKSKT